MRARTDCQRFIDWCGSTRINLNTWQRKVAKTLFSGKIGCGKSTLICLLHEYEENLRRPGFQTREWFNVSEEK
jgi:ABC-type phosphate transport system ATPase subunit